MKIFPHIMYIKDKMRVSNVYICILRICFGNPEQIMRKIVSLNV